MEAMGVGVAVLVALGVLVSVGGGRTAWAQALVSIKLLTLPVSPTGSVTAS